MYEEQIGHIPDGPYLSMDDLIHDVEEEAGKANITLDPEDGTIEVRDGNTTIKTKIPPYILKTGLAAAAIIAAVTKLLGLW